MFYADASAPARIMSSHVQRHACLYASAPRRLEARAKVSSSIGPGHKLGTAGGDSPASAAAGSAAPDSAEGRRAAMAAAAEARAKAVQQ